MSDWQLVNSFGFLNLVIAVPLYVPYIFEEHTF